MDISRRKILINAFFKSQFNYCPDKDESVSIHHQHIQKLGIEMFKVFNDENPQIVNEIFHIRDRPLMNFDKDRVFISLQLIPFSAVQKVYDFSVRKSGNLYQMILKP